MKRLAAIALLIFVIGAGAPPAAAKAPPRFLIIRGFRVQFRGDAPHRFGSCVAQPVNHFHVELFQLNGSRARYLANLHIGSYQNGRTCYVAWDPYHDICVRSCDPSKWRGLRTVSIAAVRDLLTMVGIVIGVAIVITLGTAIGYALAGAL